MIRLLFAVSSVIRPCEISVNLLRTCPFQLKPLMQRSHLQPVHCSRILSGVSISTDDRRNASATLLKEVGYLLFPPKKKHIVCMNKVMDKNRICSRGNVCNLVLLSLVHCLQELIVWLINQNLSKTQIFLNGKLALLYSV